MRIRSGAFATHTEGRETNRDFVGVRNSGDRRFPAFFSWDMQIFRDWNLVGKYKLRVGVKIFNITNHFNPRDVQASLDDPSFGGFFNGVPRLSRGKLEIFW